MGFGALAVMRSISDLTRLIEDQIKAIVGDPARALLRPLIDKDRSFLSSDVCIRIARRRGIEPSQLANEILKKVSAAHEESWTQHAGYLNIIGKWSPCAEVITPSTDPVFVYISPRQSSEAIESYVRLAARGLLQCLLACGSACCVTLQIGGEQIHVQSVGEAPRLFERVLGAARMPRSESDRIDEEILTNFEAQGEAACTFYLFPGDIDHQLMKRGGNLPGFDERAHVHIAERGWLLGLDSLPETFSYLRNDPYLTLSLLLHLSSADRGVDVDWKIPCFSERNNLLWKISSILERLQFVAAGIDPAEAGELQKHIEPEISFIVRYLDAFHQAAAWEGETEEFIYVLHALSDAGYRLLNDANLRIALATGDLDVGRIFAQLSPTFDRISSFFYVD